MLRDPWPEQVAGMSPERRRIFREAGFFDEPADLPDQRWNDPEPQPEPSFDEMMKAWVTMHLSLKAHTETQYYDSDRATHRISLMIDDEEFSHIEIDT
jgi:hypothetical protein